MAKLEKTVVLVVSNSRHILHSLLPGAMQAECCGNNRINPHRRTFAFSPHRKPAFCGLSWEEGKLDIFSGLEERLEPFPSLKT